MDKDTIFVEPCKTSKVATVLRQVWNYVAKHYGKKKSRNCRDRYPLMGNGFHYASKVSGLTFEYAFLDHRDNVEEYEAIYNR